MMSANPQAIASKSVLPIYVLDTSAIIRYLDREAGWPRVLQVLDECSSQLCRVLISAINWGELAAKLQRDHSQAVQELTMSSLLALSVEVVPVSADRAVKGGRIKARLKIPYADAFGVELAYDSPNHTLITADFDVKPAAKEVQIEFLPTK